MQHSVSDIEIMDIRDMVAVDDAHPTSVPCHGIISERTTIEVYCMPCGVSGIVDPKPTDAMVKMPTV